MTKWVKTSEQLPPQGLKILYWDDGDCWVCWRMGPYWLPTVFTDSMHAKCTPPEMWSYIVFPGKFDGKIKIGTNNESGLITIDELEAKCAERHRDFCEMLAKPIKDRMVSPPGAPC